MSTLKKPWVKYGMWRPVAHLSFVGIRRLRVDALVVDDVLEGSVHVAAVAALVAVFARTVHQVLGAEVDQLPRGLGQLSLQGPRGAEGPAGATGALRSKQIPPSLRGSAFPRAGEAPAESRR